LLLRWTVFVPRWTPVAVRTSVAAAAVGRRKPVPAIREIAHVVDDVR